MGRSSKFIAGEVRLRSPSWKAWAFVSIALCPAFAGADRATAGSVTVYQSTVPVNLPPSAPEVIDRHQSSRSSMGIYLRSTSQPQLPERQQTDTIRPRPSLYFSIGTWRDSREADNGGGTAALPGGV